MTDKLGRYHSWQDAHASLFGKLLLMRAFREQGEENFCLSQMRYTQYNRPYLGSGFDFNISHSGSYVLCAYSDEYNIGIDVEEIKPIVLSDFREQWTEAEWSQILNAKEHYRQFYRFWTQKEAIIKADGRGLSIPLKEIILEGQIASVGTTRWYLREFALTDEYIAHLATDRPPPEIIPAQMINFYHEPEIK